MKKRSLAGIVRERLKDYETRSYNGEHQCVFVEELEKEGYKISLNYFRNLIFFARKKTPPSLVTTAISEIEITRSKEKAKKGFVFNGTGKADDLI